MKSIMTALMVGVLLLFFIVALASVPQLINFQGVLTDAGGTPIVNDTRSVQFRIWDAAAGGSSKWDETQNVTTDGQGRFIVLLGTVSPVVDSAFNGPDRWLGIRVDTDPELSPRTRLMSTGYAYRTGSIDEALGGTVFGSINLDSISPGIQLYNSGIISKRGIVFIHNYGSENTCLGENAGLFNFSGTKNTAAGYQSLYSNLVDENSAFGAYALRNNTSGLNNTAMGSYALYNNTTANNNTAVGASSLISNTTGSFNSAFGERALQDNLDGTSNTAVGYLAMWKNTTGLRNTAIGADALVNNMTGLANTACGSNALHFNTAGSNTGIGAHALYGNLTGTSNTACGNNALYQNSTANTNTAVGTQALFVNMTGPSNTAIGAHCLDGNTTGTGNCAFGVLALDSNITGDYNTAIGYKANVSTGNLTNATAIGNLALVDASNKVRIGNTSVSVIEGQVSYTFTSDKNQKENFRPVDGNKVLEKVRGMNLESWNYIGHDPEKFRHYGPMAQDFFGAFGHDGVGNIGTETTINSGDVAGILMVAVQTLSYENEVIKSENAAMKARLENLERLVNELNYELLANK